jgi:hypothetical protein
MSGHGWVAPNPDGNQANCGGPGICRECANEALALTGKVGARVVRAAAQLHPFGLSLLVGGAGKGFLVTRDGDDANQSGQAFDTIDEVEQFIANLRHPVAAMTGYERGGTIKPRTPKVCDPVHYVSYGTPGGEYKSECRAAIVTETPTPYTPSEPDSPTAYMLSLCVLDPTGLFFKDHVPHHEGDTGHDHDGSEIPARSYRGGSWHWGDHE